MYCEPFAINFDLPQFLWQGVYKCENRANVEMDNQPKGWSIAADQSLIILIEEESDTYEYDTCLIHPPITLKGWSRFLAPSSSGKERKAWGQICRPEPW